MKLFPSIFVNHGGGPLPLLGKQPEVMTQLTQITSKWLKDSKPDAIVVFSAHWESDPIQVTSSIKPPMIYDYEGYPPEAYKYEYPAPGSPELALKIQNLLQSNGLKSELNDTRGYDHGVFIPLMVMYPDADIPVVEVSIHSSLSADINMQIGKALAPLRKENILLLGSGYSYHNLEGFFHPSSATYAASSTFNAWLKETITSNSSDRLLKLQNWDKAPSARECHPREEHLLPLLMIAATASPDTDAQPEIIYETEPGDGSYATSTFYFK